MPGLTERDWRLKYTPDDGDLVREFYVPALECAVHYDRSTGYFSAPALALAMRGIEGLVRNGGRMRLIVGCTLEPEELAAIEKGESLRDAVRQRLEARPLEPPDVAAHDALELLAWMIGQGILEVKVAVPCDSQRKPIAAEGIFHEKAGVIEDASGNRLAFNGSINETYAGWKKNWESFNVFLSWAGGNDYVDREAADFAMIWADKAKRVVTLDVPNAVKQDLLRFMPKCDLPARLSQTTAAPAPVVKQPPKPKPPPPADLRRLVWEFIERAPALPDGGARVGEATCAVEPWPHQIRAFERLYNMNAPRLLIADEVGLGKTIQAGMLLRQMWLSGRAKRILILTPAAVMWQWQTELREKFNLNWPVYDDGCFHWVASPGLVAHAAKPVSQADWHKEPVVIASSHLMRRRSRESQLCEDADPWDVVVLDEAHHARRRGAGSAAEEGPNALLRLMRRLQGRTKGLLLLTATPMQVHPVELWDLLSLLGLPPGWDEAAFLRYFQILAKTGPSHPELDELAAMFRETEKAYGDTTTDALARLNITNKFQATRVLKALRDASNIPRQRLDGSDRAATLRLLRATTPVSKLVSRHTRELLRRYHDAGKLDTPIARRCVEDEFITMSPQERAVYEAVEDYISTTYNAAAVAGGAARNAVGFVMTVYRRRLASSFRALRYTLEARLAPPTSAQQQGSHAKDSAPYLRAADDVADDDSRDEAMEANDAAALEQAALKLEEQADVQSLLRSVSALAPDSKAKKLTEVLERLRADGYSQAMVFTQFTDTMDFLRDFLISSLGAAESDAAPLRILCFSGRGGEALAADKKWHPISRDEVKRRFRSNGADVLLCTDAAAEGLNFQFCGALVNYDMPWNPMRVEQRIGRIDRLGQQHSTIRVVNLHYSNTIETDVYIALRKRIGLFESVVGRLQPILAELPRTISNTVLSRGGATADARAHVASTVLGRVEAIESDPSGLDLDLLSADVLDVPQRPAPALDLSGLDAVIQRRELLPPGVEVRPLGTREYAYHGPGMAEEIRVTTDPAFYDDNSESVELWSPGSPAFPRAKEVGVDSANPNSNISDTATLPMLLNGTMPSMRPDTPV